MRDSTSRVLAMVWASVCLSVRLSHFAIVSKWYTS